MRGGVTRTSLSCVRFGSLDIRERTRGVRFAPTADMLSDSIDVR